MQVQLKNLKVLEKASDETYCFEAVVYVDGVKCFNISNAGHGGCNDHWPINVPLYNEVCTWAKTLPSKTYKMGEDSFELESDIDSIVDSLVVEELRYKDIKKDLSKKVLLYKEGKTYSLNIPKSSITNPAHKKILEDKYNPDGYVILNYLSDQELREFINYPEYANS